MSILLSFRQFHDWNEIDLAKGLEITVAEYRDLESGIGKVDSELALKLSKLYAAPPYLFLGANHNPFPSVVFSQCNFENSNGYVNQLYVTKENNLESIEETIQFLREEIKLLHEKIASFYAL